VYLLGNGKVISYIKVFNILNLGSSSQNVGDLVVVVLTNVGDYISASKPRSCATSTGLVNKAVGSRVVGRSGQVILVCDWIGDGHVIQGDLKPHPENFE
jgi:hypothetical protein